MLSSDISSDDTRSRNRDFHFDTYDENSKNRLYNEDATHSTCTYTSAQCREKYSDNSSRHSSGDVTGNQFKLFTPAILSPTCPCDSTPTVTHTSCSNWNQSSSQPLTFSNVYSQQFKILPEKFIPKTDIDMERHNGKFAEEFISKTDRSSVQPFIHEPSSLHFYPEQPFQPVPQQSSSYQDMNSEKLFSLMAPRSIKSTEPIKRGCKQGKKLISSRRTTGKKSHVCGECGKVFSKSNNLKQHGRVHTREKPFKCEMCGKFFSSASLLRSHTRLHTGEHPYKCDLCEKCFRSSGDLWTHKKIHKGHRPFQCHVCKKTFIHSSHVLPHMRIHTGERPFSCDVCGKKFTQSSGLKAHMRGHTGERPYKCGLCDNAYSRAADLKVHVRVHTGERPFTCDACGRKFARAPDLKKHERTHTGLKPYKCDICHKTFATSSHRERHLKIHTGEKPHACRICGKSFISAHDLKRHGIVHRNKEKDTMEGQIELSDTNTQIS